jgi:hypothetical protein
MVLRKYAGTILGCIKDLSATDLRIVIWMALHTQYKTGIIKMDRLRMRSEVKAHNVHVSRCMKRLKASGLIEQLPGRNHYRVKISVPVGKYSIQVPPAKFFTEE